MGYFLLLVTGAVAGYFFSEQQKINEDNEKNQKIEEDLAKLNESIKDLSHYFKKSESNE